MNQAIKTLALGEHPLLLGLSQNKPYVEVEGARFCLLWHLVHAYPRLSSLECVDLFAEVSNFLWKGVDFIYIQDIEAYRTFYWSQVEIEQKQPADLFVYRLTDYPIFDLSVMRAPYINEEGYLCYFVYQAATALPYRVVSPFPYTSTSTVVHYQILPIAS